MQHLLEEVKKAVFWMLQQIVYRPVTHEITFTENMAERSKQI